MNSNYQLNKFYAQDRMNARLKEARHHNQARQARRQNGRTSLASFAAAQVAGAYHGAGRIVSRAGQGLERLGKAGVSALYPRYR